ncbi:11782_t:CDS:2 [Rhizophagus irregularis]|nr:11782_t:CDS:2 [Rhizophagus irregularis]
MNNLLVIFLIFVTFASSTPIRRQDALSGFKPCKGINFPNEITTYIYTPNPLQAGQEATIHIAGKATVTIENGALYNITGITGFDDTQISHREISFCEAIVTPSGFTCPVKENFDFIAKFVEASSPNDPKNTVKEYLIRIQITNPDVTDDFDLTVNITAKTIPNDPKNSVLEFFTMTLNGKIDLTNTIKKCDYVIGMMKQFNELLTGDENKNCSKDYLKDNDNSDYRILYNTWSKEPRNKFISRYVENTEINGPVIIIKENGNIELDAHKTLEKNVLCKNDSEELIILSTSIFL